MRKYFYLAYDLACICGALVAALYLRHGIPLIQEGQPQDLYLLLLVTFGTALVVLPLMRTNISMWRYTSSAELASIMIAVALVILVCNSSLFLISRLDMMPRSVPAMHWALAVLAMGGSRMMARKLFGPSSMPSKHKKLKQHVIVVGACHTAELYLQFIKRIVQHEIVVEGLVDSDKALTGRVFQKHKILGTPADLPQVLEQLHVHGIHIKQVVLAQLLADLPQHEQDLLNEMKQNGVIDLVQFAKHMTPQAETEPVSSVPDFYHATAALALDRYKTPEGVYPYVKRWFDVVVGVVLLVLFSPLLALASLLVALDVGHPLLFWQQRPGLHGKAFRLYKFRTMKQSGRKLTEDRLTHKSSDITRMSFLGKMLRRLRLDELPQLFHIIAGTMSFVGPRPLLPEDQPANGIIRLSARPGVTGWAQIHGGDALTPEEKLLLDVWYIQHMSLWLDIRILLRTLLVVFKVDKPRTQVIEQIRKGSAA